MAVRALAYTGCNTALASAPGAAACPRPSRRASQACGQSGHAQDVTAGRYVRLGSPMLLYHNRVSFKL
jgi:hypothetical protein